MTGLEILPDSRAKNDRTIAIRNGERVVPFYCASCGVEMGRAPASDVVQCLTFLCEANQNDCVAKFGELIGLRKVRSPEEVKFARFADAQLECFGRYLSVEEAEILFAEVDHPLTKLARELFPQFNV